MPDFEGLYEKYATDVLRVCYFYLGDRHFGTLTAYVEGGSADNFRFTAALPVQEMTAAFAVCGPGVSAAVRGTSLPVM